ACETHVRSAFDDGAAVRKDGDLVRSRKKAEREFIRAHFAERFERRFKLNQIQRASALMNLDCVAAAEAYGRALGTAQINKLASAAGGALGVAVRLRHLADDTRPDIDRGDTGEHALRTAGQDLQRVGGLQSCDSGRDRV